MTGVSSAHEHTNGTGTGLPQVPSIPLSDEAPAPGEQSIGGLVRDATTHLSTLVRAEVELAKQEVKGEVKKGLKGSIWFILALVVLLYSSFFFFFFIAELLSVWLPSWAAYGIVFLGMLGSAGLAAFLGYRKVKAIRAPQRTIDTMKGTAAALRRGGDDTDDAVATMPPGDVRRG